MVPSGIAPKRGRPGPAPSPQLPIPSPGQGNSAPKKKPKIHLAFEGDVDPRSKAEAEVIEIANDVAEALNDQRGRLAKIRTKFTSDGEHPMGMWEKGAPGLGLLEAAKKELVKITVLGGNKALVRAVANPSEKDLKRARGIKTKAVKDARNTFMEIWNENMGAIWRTTPARTTRSYPPWKAKTTGFLKTYGYQFDEKDLTRIWAD